MDLSGGMVKEVRARFGGAVKAVEGDAERMPFDAETFDIMSVIVRSW